MLIAKQKYNKIRTKGYVYLVEYNSISGCPRLSRRTVICKHKVDGHVIFIKTKENYEEALLHDRLFTSKKDAQDMYKKLLLEYKVNNISCRDRCIKEMNKFNRRIDEANWKLDRINK